MNAPSADTRSSPRPHGLARMQLLASVAMRPEALTAKEVGLIRREFETLKASLH